MSGSEKILCVKVLNMGWLMVYSDAVKQLTELLNSVKDEQSYIIVRERTHRNTAESTNARVKWWSIFQLGVLIGEGIFQVWWLKRFFEVGIILFCMCERTTLMEFSQVKRVV